jgi:simple sugar transport system permease protein
MSATTSTLQTGTAYVPQTRRRVLGFAFLGLAAFIWLVFLRAVDPTMDTTMRLYPGGSTVVIDDWVFKTQTMLWILTAGCAAVGAFQLVRGFGRRTGLAFALVGIMFVFAFLSWAASGASLNLAGMLRIMLVRSVPLTLGALSGILCERAGVFNIAIEGMMLTAAMVGTLVGSVSTLWIGLFGAILAGGLLGLVHGVICIKYRTDQIISGTVINIFAVGITSFISGKFLQPFQELNDPGIFVPYEIPLLSQIPFLGPVLFRNNLFVYSMILLVIFLTFMLFKTRWGLRHRAVGEHPKAADTLGINVNRTRYIAVILGGMMAGFAGAYFTLGSVGKFDQVMTAGRGFIALAAMLFGNYMPVGAMIAGLIFGFSDSLAASLALMKVKIPGEFLLMTPYLLTMVVLAGVVGRSRPPAAGGKPYEKE